ncbi:hypothetical protein KTQ42_18600 [Noviherbaspirillum sp. L7-7A]|uniref:hypothetical protein n=1 Tax=Noviherbaspirillum sp. L7-7A TaxID=2850560 RepID=UPI001C2BDD4F|nr:hypothetical protein [Noviherbaspirillum sp. L7-7A]MBV0881304.1 hypothetical protein [Noviherbaspirillum sp. L7-7A]
MSEQRWFKLASSMGELVRKVAGLKIRLLPLQGDASQPLAPALDFGLPGPAYERLRRVHYRNKEPYCLIEIHLDKKIFDSDPQGGSSAPVVPQLAARKEVTIAHAR